MQPYKVRFCCNAGRDARPVESDMEVNADRPREAAERCQQRAAELYANGDASAVTVKQVSPQEVGQYTPAGVYFK